MGRWVSRDLVDELGNIKIRKTLFESHDVNEYGFCLNRPTDLFDLFGLSRGDIIYFTPPNPKGDSDFPFHAGFDKGNNKILMLTGYPGTIQTVDLDEYTDRTGKKIAGYADISDYVTADQFESNIGGQQSALEKKFVDWSGVGTGTMCVDVIIAGLGDGYKKLKADLCADYIKDNSKYEIKMNDPYFWRKNLTYKTFFKNTNRFRRK
jgi:hypothetical protein